MHLNNIVIVMIKFEMMTSSWKLNSKLLCWELDSRNNHEIEYDSQIFVSSVNLICQNVQCVFRYELFSLRINAGNYFRKKSITFMKISFDFVPSICTRKVFPVSDHMHWKCWDLAGILHNIPSIYTGKPGRYSWCLIRRFVPEHLVCIIHQISQWIASSFSPFPVSDQTLGKSCKNL